MAASNDSLYADRSVDIGAHAAAEGRLEASPSLVYGAALLMRLGASTPSRVRIPEPPPVDDSTLAGHVPPRRQAGVILDLQARGDIFSKITNRYGRAAWPSDTARRRIHRKIFPMQLDTRRLSSEVWLLLIAGRDGRSGSGDSNGRHVRVCLYRTSGRGPAGSRTG